MSVVSVICANLPGTEEQNAGCCESRIEETPVGQSSSACLLPRGNRNAAALAPVGFGGLEESPRSAIALLLPDKQPLAFRLWDPLLPKYPCLSASNEIYRRKGGSLMQSIDGFSLSVSRN